MKRSKRKKLNRTLLCAAVIMLCGNAADTVSATEGGAEGKASFSVNITLPDNQRDETSAYYDLMMDAGQEQELELEVRNLADEKKVIDAELTTAYTTAGGVVEYSRSDKTEPDDSLRYRMEDLVMTESRIEVEKDEVYTLKLKVKMPAESFEGLLAGGITLREQDGEEETGESGGAGMTIINKYSYSIAILLRESENEIKPELILNEVKADQFNARNAISGNFQNIQPAYLNDMRTDAWVTRRGETERLYEYNDTNMQMAPNSNFNYFIPLDGEKYVAGDYTFTAEVEGSGETWLLTRDFTITVEEARDLNAADLTLEEDNLFLFIAIGAVVVLLVVTIIIVSVRKKKKRRKAMQMRRLRQQQMRRR